jgi:hypothetical protein
MWRSPSGFGSGCPSRWELGVFVLEEVWVLDPFREEWQHRRVSRTCIPMSLNINSNICRNPLETDWTISGSISITSVLEVAHPNLLDSTHHGHLPDPTPNFSSPDDHLLHPLEPPPTTTTLFHNHTKFRRGPGISTCSYRQTCMALASTIPQNWERDCANTALPPSRDHEVDFREENVVGVHSKSSPQISRTSIRNLNLLDRRFKTSIR